MTGTKKAFGRWMSALLAVAMVFTLNLTGITVHAAAAKPTSQTEVAAPAGVTAATIGGQNAAFYQDDNGSQIYLRYIYPGSTEASELQSVSVSLTSRFEVTSDEVSVSKSGTTYTFTADLRNNAPVISIRNTDYIVAAGIEAGTGTPAGFVTSAQINGAEAQVGRHVQNNPCPGNIYYKENGIDWISVTNYITAREVGQVEVPSETALSYSIDGGEPIDTTLDLTTGTAPITLGAYTYTVNATFVEGFVATKSNFWVDFREMRNSKAAGKIPDELALAQAREIEAGVDAYYKDGSVSKKFPAGSTNMDVMQAIMEYSIANGYYSYPEETTVGSGVTYIAEINGLGEFDVGSLSGWMYTDNPYQAHTNPENWYTAPVGAASYVLSTTSQIAWFFTVDYGTHPW
ncbi:MAG: hypothetical protein Q4C82_08590 [Eubacteriales bacterium]|nr:hypothetical protein [Eubacteriales bacterium]